MSLYFSFLLLTALFLINGCAEDKRENAIKYATKLAEWAKTPEFEKLYIDDAVNKSGSIKRKEFEIAKSCGFDSPEEVAMAENELRNDKEYLNLKLEYVGAQMALETKIELNMKR